MVSQAHVVVERTFYNTVYYEQYRVIFPTSRDIDEGHPISIAEVQLFGYLWPEGYIMEPYASEPPTIRYAEELISRRLRRRDW